jgi:hypothetical protein
MNIAQKGISSITLYENIGLSFIRDESGQIDTIATLGNKFELSECENFGFDLIIEQELGENDKWVYTYTITFWLFGFDSFDMLDKLNSVFGYIPVIVFRDNTVQKLVNCVFKLNRVEYSEQVSQVYPISMSNQLPTFEAVRDFGAVIPVWILDTSVWNGEGLWTTDGLWNGVPADAFLDTDIPGGNVDENYVPGGDEIVIPT